MDKHFDELCKVLNSSPVLRESLNALLNYVRCLQCVVVIVIPVPVLLNAFSSIWSHAKNKKIQTKIRFGLYERHNNLCRNAINHTSLRRPSMAPFVIPTTAVFLATLVQIIKCSLLVCKALLQYQSTHINNTITNTLN